MDVKLNKKGETFAAIIGFVFLTLSSPCHSRNEQDTALPDTAAASSQSNSLRKVPNESIITSDTTQADKKNLSARQDSSKKAAADNLQDKNSVPNKKAPLWIPAAEAAGFNIGLWAADRFVLKEDFARISLKSWSDNIRIGWTWDSDRFGENFFGHPYQGGVYFTAARSNGYCFWESAPFAVGGSIMWEYFGENTLPSRDDLVITSLSGVFYGEILYRLSTAVLDDRTSGTERIIREAGAAAISPMSFFNRLVQGKLTKVTPDKDYQKESLNKEPLNIETDAGIRQANNGSRFGTGPQTLTLTARIDYGDPFENKDRKPFDYFKVRVGLSSGVGSKVLDNISGYGLLFGKNVQAGDLAMLMGIFHHYNYYNNNTFELATMAFSGGVLSNYPLSKGSNFYANIHAGVIPFAGNSTQRGPFDSLYRDYNYCTGMESIFESGCNLGWGSIELIAYYSWLHSIVQDIGENYVSIIRPRIALKLINNISIGAEEMVYLTDRYLPQSISFHGMRTEQRVYLMFNEGPFKP